MIIYGHDLSDEDTDSWLEWLELHGYEHNNVPVEFEVDYDHKTNEVIVECFAGPVDVYLMNPDGTAKTVRVRKLKKKDFPKERGINKLRTIIR